MSHVIENLPYPFVFYPGYGAFIGFKERLKDWIVFCSCAEKAIKNYLRIKLIEHFDQTITALKKPKVKDWFSYARDFNPTLRFLLQEFPDEYISETFLHESLSDIPLLDRFTFEDNLCHECNCQSPTKQWGDIYQSEFKHQYGWYVKKQLYEYGIMPGNNQIVLEDECPEKIKRFYDPKKYFQKDIEDAVENEVREKFRYKSKGEEWISETLLFKKIQQEFPDLRVIHHGRPVWLGRQHFDIWLPDINTAIEYQGIQHFKPIKIFNSEAGLKATKDRDRRKKMLCDCNGVDLIKVKENYDLEKIISHIKKMVRPKAD
jgi:hypothetical protein